MIVYVETNFIFEIALQQREQAHCWQLLEFADRGDIELAIPAYSITEPYEKLIRKERERKDLSARLRTELGELGRSAAYGKAPRRYADVAQLLIASSQEEHQRLAEIQKRLLELATVIGTNREVLKTALVAQREMGIGPQDSIVYASVQQHLSAHRSASCFINKNTKDFSELRIQASFKAYNCPIIPSFENGLGHIAAYLQRKIDDDASPH